MSVYSILEESSVTGTSKADTNGPAPRVVRSRTLDAASTHPVVVHAHAPAGRSQIWQQVLSLVRRLAPSDRPVLISGPTGAGKEVVAQFLHQQSSRSNKPLLAINCGALPEALIESQLFGHERGAFTGADVVREGFFSSVGDGTLFLDEIGELPLALQPKLLRVLETRLFRPLGAQRERSFQGRVVAATHRDLPTMVERGLFREDLLYRLNVFEVSVPSLDQRREDIPGLVELFSENQVREMHFTTEALVALAASPWPGNVRQLKSVVDRMAILCDDQLMTFESVAPFLPTKPVQSVPSSLPPTSPAQDGIAAVAAAVLRLDMTDKLSAITKAMIELAMRESAGNKSAAARLLGVHRKVIERQVL